MIRLIALAVVLVLATSARSQEKFYLTADGKSVEKRILDEHSKKIADLEKEVQMLKDQMKIGVTTTKNPYYNSGQPCACGCNETGKCTCQTCNKRTGDPTYPGEVEKASKPIVNPNWNPQRITCSDGTLAEMRSDGSFWKVESAPTVSVPVQVTGTTCVGGVCYPSGSVPQTNIFGKPKRW